EIPVTEKTILKSAESPYGLTKQMGEQIVNEFAKSSGTQSILLRYFNPAGAHPSIHIGEMPIGTPSNLIPAITQTAIGRIPKMQVGWNPEFSLEDILATAWKWELRLKADETVFSGQPGELN